MGLKNKTKAKEYSHNWHLKHRDEERRKTAQYYKTHKDKILSLNKKYREKNKEKIKKYNQKREKEGYRLNLRYNLSLTEYNKIKEQQENKCAICQRIDLELFVDHNHETNKVRGLLCRHCNWLLGHAGENIDILFNAIKYLKLKKE